MSTFDADPRGPASIDPRLRQPDTSYYHPVHQHPVTRIGNFISGVLFGAMMGAFALAFWAWVL